MSLLQTHNLTIGYGDKPLVSDINVSLESGQFIGLIGQNGVGKSTLIRTLAGFQEPLGGSISLGGRELIKLNPKEISKKLGVVLTEKPTALNLSVLELISLGRHPYSGWLGQLRQDDVEKIEEAIEQTQIHHILNKRLYQLSDGQLQKVMIARVLAQDTDVILLDEPTSHLDLRNKIEVLDLLKKISQSGKGVLISTHEIHLSAKVCDMYWGVDFGVPMEIGVPDEMLLSGKVQELLHLEGGAI
ncbi:MAG: ABC transporter ATP-binding protein [Cytophagales bacterium]|nr:ABC transporter ATP-binding protein [Cytophagales bacterium]